MKNNSISQPRNGCKDMWNAFMVEGADFVPGSDIPFCPCTTEKIPEKLISYVEAKHLHKLYHKEKPDYQIGAFVHFYIDDQKIDGPQTGIWVKPFDALEIIRHFSGAITPDFSTYADFPDPIKRYNTYRMRAFGRWLSTEGIQVINNVRWGTEETWSYCFDGIPLNSIVAIGTVASRINQRIYRSAFENGFFRFMESKKPHTLLVYGSSNYKCFTAMSESGVRIISFPSQTSLAFASRKGGHNYE